MKLVHIHAKSDVSPKLSASALKKLPKLKFGVVTTIQHVDSIGDVVKQIKGKLAGQVLGCNALSAKNIAKDVDAYLFVGTGEFHPLNVAWKTQKPVYIWNPSSKVLSEISGEEVGKYQTRLRGLVNKFMHAEDVGVVVSLKIGQKNFAHAREFSQRKDKNYYLFVADSINYSEFENFPFIDFWINTACPRIQEDLNNIINIDDLADALDFKFKAHIEKPIWKGEL